MGLLKSTNREYYQGYDLGNYQFTSLEDIVNQFMVVYTGDNKMIKKASRIDVAFHAQRALAELSFDTFKSVKSHQITLPPSLVMPLPHDYVNYTKLSWADSSGIKHPLYHTSSTNNPFQIDQLENGSYNFAIEETGNDLLVNGNFGSDDSFYNANPSGGWSSFSARAIGASSEVYGGGTGVIDGKLQFSFTTRNGLGGWNWGYVWSIYQSIDVSEMDYLNISALGAADTLTIIPVANPPTGSTQTTHAPFSTSAGPLGSPGYLRFGISTNIPDVNQNNINNITSAESAELNQSSNTSSDFYNLTTDSGDPSYIEWIAPAAGGTTTSTKELEAIDVKSQNIVYAVITSFVEFDLPTGTAGYGYRTWDLGSQYDYTGTGPIKANSIDNITVTSAQASTKLKPKPGNEANSSTWNNYKSGTPSENQDDYQDDTYWPMDGSRFGLDPQHAQANGSFFIDPRLGRIHFSSNISGKDVILDYISDSLGTDGEMQVHKFAEEAMYKCIAHAILSGSSYGQQLVPRLTKEKFAAIRKAKLRLSNIKLEELTQILRGKSKQIKH